MFLLKSSTHRMVIKYHPVIGHLYVPNINARIPHESGGYFVRTNAQGFRSDVDFDKQKNNRPRILVFGDSNIAGDGVDNEQRFSDIIGRVLNAEVYNYALSGSGTDQQLLIYEEFANQVEADLIIWCIPIFNINRIQITHRKSVDRTAGRQVMVPKPYFTLEGEQLKLHHVPVPRERPFIDQGDPGEEKADKLLKGFRTLRAYLDSPKLVRGKEFISERFPQVDESLMRMRGKINQLRWGHPFPDYLSEESNGWQLMQAIINRLLDQIGNIPVLICPMPTGEFYLQNAEPSYKKRFQSLSNANRKVYVADVLTGFRQLSFPDRKGLTYQRDLHLSPEGHRLLADIIVGEIFDRQLLPDRSGTEVNPATIAIEGSASGEHMPHPKQVPSKYILGLSCFYHNSAASLIKDGEIISAAEEERFTRVKNDRRFPHFAANYCLEEGGIHQNELAAVVYYDNVYLTFERLLHTQLAVGSKGKASWIRILPAWTQYKLYLPQLIREYLKYDGLILHNTHHRSHAASAFYPSPFKKAAILTIDGVGEWATASISIGNDNQIKQLKEMHFPHSLGLLYSAFTQFTGFKVNSGEYKMMGLAPYGKPKYVDTIMNHLLDVKEDGSIELNLEYFAFLSEQRMTNERFADLFGGPPRKPESRITQREMDLARSIQVVTEEVILRMGRHAYKVTGENNLCLAGGVALNCVANGRLLKEGPFNKIWIQPAAGDAGCALGAALDVYHTYFDRPRNLGADGRSIQKGSLWGPSFSEDEIQAFLDLHKYPYHKVDPAERAEKIAKLIDDGKIIGHFSDRLEYGPRALGSRSIIGDPRNEEMQSKINLKIKFRESFRPFAPTVLVEKVSDYFELDCASPYMLLVFPVKKNRRKTFERGKGEDLLKIVRQSRSDIPSVTHVDYSARVQTITHEDHPTYYELINAFEGLSGYGVIVNTSFNIRGEPIVCTPYDAYRCFMRTDMDVLVLGNYLLFKEEQSEWPESGGPLENHDLEAKEDHLESLAEKLEKLYQKEFLAVTEDFSNSPSLRITAKVHRVQTTWRDSNPDQSPQTIFTIDTELDKVKPDPVKMALAITKYWERSAVTDALTRIVRDMLKMRERGSSQSLGMLEEKVDDAIYVMY